MKSIQKYNRTLDISLLDDIDCICKDEWRERLQENPKPFHERLAPVVEFVSE